jgi:hypothetical protein
MVKVGEITSFFPNYSIFYINFCFFFYNLTPPTTCSYVYSIYGLCLLYLHKLGLTDLRDTREGLEKWLKLRINQPLLPLLILLVIGLGLLLLLFESNQNRTKVELRKRGQQLTIVCILTLLLHLICKLTFPLACTAIITLTTFS